MARRRRLRSPFTARLQVYVRPEVRARLDNQAAVQGATLGELVDAALDQMLLHQVQIAALITAPPVSAEAVPA